MLATLRLNCKNFSTVSFFGKTFDNLATNQGVFLQFDLKIVVVFFQLQLKYINKSYPFKGESSSGPGRHAEIDEFQCMVTGCALGTDVCHWLFTKKPGPKNQHDSRLTRFPFNTYTARPVCWREWIS